MESPFFVLVKRWMMMTQKANLLDYQIVTCGVFPGQVHQPFSWGEVFIADKKEITLTADATANYLAHVSLRLVRLTELSLTEAKLA